jgi:hypothetical protein
VMHSTPDGAGGADVELRYGDVPVGAGSVPRTTPVTYGMAPFAVGYLPQAPITPALSGRSAIPDGVVKRVVFDILRRNQPEPPRDHVDLATQ